MTSRVQFVDARVGRSGRSTPFPLIALLALAALLAPQIARGGKLFGGNDAIPLKDNVSVDLTLPVEFNNLPPVLDDIFQVNIQKDLIITSQGGAFTTQIQLGASLAQSISASNRPSVLTPFAGTLYGEGEDAVFDSYGSLVTNKATTIGKGNLGIGVSYQHARFTKFNGRDIGEAVSSKMQAVNSIDQLPVDDPFLGVFTVDLDQVTTAEVEITNVKFTTDVITLAITYGLLDRMDVGALIPYVFLQREGKGKLTVHTQAEIAVTNRFGRETFGRTGSASQTIKDEFDIDEDGLGDIILFSKFQVLSQAGIIGKEHRPAPIDLALQAEVKLPTGDEDKFVGTGETDVAVRMIVQREIIPVYLIVRGEVGYNESGLGGEFDTMEYKAGVEWIPLSNFAISGEIIAQDSDAFRTITDGLIGAKYIFGNQTSIFAGVRFPLNDNGLRYGWSPILGVEKTFAQLFGGEADFSDMPDREMPDFEPVDTMEPVEGMEPVAPMLDGMEPVNPGAAPAGASAPAESAPAEADTTKPEGRENMNDLPPRVLPDFEPITDGRS